MNTEPDLAAQARAIIDGNVYLVLGTADRDGNPWTNPVYFAADRYTDFYWISSPEVTHSRNIAHRPQVSIAIFDSRQPTGTGAAVYLSALAEEVPDADIARGLAVYPGPADRGGRPLTPDQLRPPSPYRLYRARSCEYSMLCPRSTGPCARHGRAFDHRTTVPDVAVVPPQW